MLSIPRLGIDTTSRALTLPPRSIRFPSNATSSNPSTAPVTPSTSVEMDVNAARNLAVVVADSEKSFLDIVPVHRFYQKELIYLAEHLLPQGTRKQLKSHDDVIGRVMRLS